MKNRSTVKRLDLEDSKMVFLTDPTWTRWTWPQLVDYIEIQSIPYHDWKLVDIILIVPIILTV